MNVQFNDDDAFLDDDGAAQLLGIATKTLQNKISKGLPVPPFIEVPHLGRRWRRKTILNWLCSFEGQIKPRPMNRRPRLKKVS